LDKASEERVYIWPDMSSDARFPLEFESDADFRDKCVAFLRAADKDYKANVSAYSRACLLAVAHAMLNAKNTFKGKDSILFYRGLLAFYGAWVDQFLDKSDVAARKQHIDTIGKWQKAGLFNDSATKEDLKKAANYVVKLMSALLNADQIWTEAKLSMNPLQPTTPCLHDGAVSTTCWASSSAVEQEKGDKISTNFILAGSGYYANLGCWLLVLLK
jgi:hypothetical protein